MLSSLHMFSSDEVARKRMEWEKRLHILSDTVERITDGVKDYFLSAIDAKMKFA
ncbi:hypothetical protein HYV22_03540 [Candidatus Gottesmanbacteria bacterium]|nr:hypothetical protein [Candidatus Gottesmanbacteria bacterium]